MRSGLKSKTLRWLSCVLMMLLGPAAQANDYSRHPQFLSFVDKVVSEHQLSRPKVLNLFEGVKRQQNILDLMSKPAEKTKEWYQYRPIFLTDKQISQGVEFWQQHKNLLEKAEKRYQVPAEIIVAIIGVETRYGRNKGQHRALDALSTLAFDYPPRSPFFLSELTSLVVLSQKADYLQVAQLKSSYAGAFGYGQFMPSSYRDYAVDFDGDGRIDLVNSVADAIGSVAHYFQQKGGWKWNQPVVFQLSTTKLPAEKLQQLDKLANLSLETNQQLATFKQLGVTANLQLPANTPVTLVRLMQADGPEYWLGFNNYYAITRYNHSRLYAMAAWQLSQAIAAQMHVR